MEKVLEKISSEDGEKRPFGPLLLFSGTMEKLAGHLVGFTCCPSSL